MHRHFAEITLNGREQIVLDMSYKGILDRQLPKGRDEVSLSAFAFLFSEIIQYCQSTVSNVSELERRSAPSDNDTHQ